MPDVVETDEKEFRVARDDVNDDCVLYDRWCSSSSYKQQNYNLILRQKENLLDLLRSKRTCAAYLGPNISFTHSHVG